MLRIGLETLGRGVWETTEQGGNRPGGWCPEGSRQPGRKGKGRKPGSCQLSRFTKQQSYTAPVISFVNWCWQPEPRGAQEGEVNQQEKVLKACYLFWNEIAGNGEKNKSKTRNLPSPFLSWMESIFWGQLMRPLSYLDRQKTHDAKTVSSEEVPCYI